MFSFTVRSTPTTVLGGLDVESMLSSRRRTTAAEFDEIMSLRDQDLDAIFAGFPALPATPEIRIDVDEEKKFGLIRALVSQADFGDGKITTVDGLRVDFEKAWGLVRASNTSAAITLRFEGETQQDIERLQQLFKQQLQKVDPGLTLDF